MPRENPDATSETELRELAGHALDFLIGDPQELARFMKNTGYDPDTLRAALETRELNLALLSHFAASESALLAMCANSGLEASRFMRCWSRQNAHL